MEVSIWPAVLILLLGGGLLFVGIRKLHHQELEQKLRQAEWEAHYAREESEIALSVSRAVVKNAAARIAKVYSNDYVDYHIARQMALPDVRQASEETRQREAKLQQQLEYYQQRDALRMAEFSEIRKDYRRLQEEEDRRRADAALRAHTAAHAKRPYTPPQYWQAQPQAPVSRQQHLILPHWDNDDDVLDIDVHPVSQPPVYPLALQSPPHDSPPPALGGRQRKYATDAERQAAYRARRRARLG